MIISVRKDVYYKIFEERRTNQMKKFTGKIFAGIFTAAVLATAAFATDYTANPDYEAPSIVEVKDDDVKAGETVKVPGEAAKVTGEALSALKDGKVTFELDNATITVSDVTDAKDVTIGVNVVTEAADTKLDSGVSVPKDAVVVTPAQQGEFGMKLTVTVATSLKDAKLYYVSTDGKTVKDVTEESNFAIADGKATFEITHASQYVISGSEIKAVAGTDDPSTGDGPDTGVTLPIALVVLAGGSVAVSAIAAKKRK